MFNKKTIVKLLKLVTRHRQGFYDKRTTHPTREWMIGLFLFVTIILLGSLQSAHIFLNYQNINMGDGIFQEKVAEYSRPLAEKALSIYSKRKDDFLLLQNSSVLTPEAVSEPITIEATSTPEVVAEEEVVATTTEEEGISGEVELVN